MLLPDDLKHVIGDFAATAARISKRCQSSTAAGPETKTAKGVRRVEKGRKVIVNPPAEVLTRKMRATLLAGVEGLEKLAKDQNAQLSSPQMFGIRAIVCIENRPAILISNGDFAAPPETWNVLRGQRAGIKNSIRCVGRVEVQGHNKPWIGTGFLAGPAAMITNRHVAIKFSQKNGTGDWVFKQGMASSVDLVKEHGSANALEYVVTEIIGCHPDHDLAVLRVESKTATGQPLPDPIALQSAPVAGLIGRQVYVIGYPGRDAGRNVPPEMERIFDSVYEVKRLQPGEAMGYTTGEYEMRHDCSTLGGNSGSPVIDLETHRVIALHFAGRYETANYAVPLWMMAGDSLLKKAGTNFQ